MRWILENTWTDYLILLLAAILIATLVFGAVWLETRVVDSTEEPYGPELPVLQGNARGADAIAGTTGAHWGWT
jgi:hypothetical protein